MCKAIAVKPEKTRLLILSCSQRKRSDPGLLPAIERYDGGNFRVLRKAQREEYLSENLDVLILSAKYGLIEAMMPIENYEQRIDRQRAIELRDQVIRTLKKYCKQKKYLDIYVEVGQDYHAALLGITSIFEDAQIKVSNGRIGERLKQLKFWLSTTSS